MTDDLTTRAQAALASLDRQVAALPDEGNEPRPNERDRIAGLRGTLINHRSRLLRDGQHYAEFGPRLDAPREWRDVLTKGIAEFEAMRADLESRPKTEHRIDRRIAEVRQSLLILTRGPNHEGGEEQTPVLATWFADHGVQADHGRYFSGRGGLVSTEARIVDLEKQRDAARADLEACIAAVEAMAVADAA
jgi:hypothetical protein